MYSPLVELMDYIQRFYSQKGVTGDAAWAEPIDPLDELSSTTKGRRQSDPPSTMDRKFVNSYNKKLRYSGRYTDPPDLKLDIAMLLVPPIGRQAMDPVYWKDVKVAIEVK